MSVLPEEREVGMHSGDGCSERAVASGMIEDELMSEP